MGATQSIPKTKVRVSPVKQVRSPVKQQSRPVRRVFSEPEAFAYFVNMHSIPARLHAKLREVGVDGRKDWMYISHHYAFVPTMAKLHKIVASRKQLSAYENDNYEPLYIHNTGDWRRGDIVYITNAPGADRNVGKLLWTGKRLVDLDYDSVDDYGSLPTEAVSIAMNNPYHWCGQGIISHNRAIPVQFDSSIAKIVNECRTKYCIFEWNSLRWGLIIDPMLRRPILNEQGRGHLFWLDITVNEHKPFSMYHVHSEYVKELVGKGVPYERILSATQEY